jgi:hypothetical protein
MNGDEHALIGGIDISLRGRVLSNRADRLNTLNLRNLGQCLEVIAKVICKGRFQEQAACVSLPHVPNDVFVDNLLPIISDTYRNTDGCANEHIGCVELAVDCEVPNSELFKSRVEAVVDLKMGHKGALAQRPSGIEAC